MLARALLGTALIASFALAGCTTPADRAHALAATQSIAPDDYDDVLGDWTRHDEVYDVLYRIAFFHVTYHSPAFRRAFLIRHPDVYGPGSEEASRLMLTNQESEDYLEFFVAASTANQRWNDFNRADSIWRITLRSDDGEPVDGKIERVKTTANLRAIYPYITPYANTYAVRFPRNTFTGEPVLTPKTKKLELRVTSALGAANMTWRIKTP
ncbi:MAG: hypothetical protein RIT81_40250 [Deltaproteobacteria bacterium]